MITVTPSPESFDACQSCGVSTYTTTRSGDATSQTATYAPTGQAIFAINVSREGSGSTYTTKLCPACLGDLSSAIYPYRASSVLRKSDDSTGALPPTHRQKIIAGIRTLIERDPRLPEYVNVEDIADFFDPDIDEQEIGDALGHLVEEGVLQYGEQEDVAFTPAYLDSLKDAD